MSIFDGLTGGISDSFESLNHAPVDNTQRFGDNHGEATTKTFMAAALAYALGGGGGYGDTTGGGALSGPSSPFGWMGGGGGDAGGGGTGGAMSYLPSALKGLGGMFGLGGQQQQQPRMNPFSPANPLSPDSPYHPTQFQNASFTPWEQNIATMGMPIQQKPMQHIFGQGNRLF